MGIMISTREHLVLAGGERSTQKLFLKPMTITRIS
jgi:hypothetical protein